jgi:trans-aconitate 2-methyltransferase
MSWNPDQYLKYSNERVRPALDLLARIDAEAPKIVLDLGCGAGNVTALLAQRWPHARMIGVDNSTEMLAKARASTAGDSRREWIDADLAIYAARGSGRCGLQQRGAPLATRSLATLSADLRLGGTGRRARGADAESTGGAVARRDRAGRRVFAMARKTGHSVAADTRAAPGRLLPPAVAKASHVDAWVTEYLHVLPAARDGVHPVVAWIKGTTLTPYLARLPEDLQRAFMDAVSQRIAAAYPTLPDGRVLFPFRRVFVVAERERRGNRFRFGQATRPICSASRVPSRLHRG